MDRFWNFKNLTQDQAELRIEGEIVGDEDAWILEWLEIPHTSPNAFREALKEHKGKALTVWIDSPGGSTFAAAGIYNALKEHDGKITVKIDSKALSAGSVIAMAGDEVLISPVGLMMIHNPWVHTTGEAADLRHVADVMDQVKEAILNAYEAKTGVSRSRISQMMDEETWMSARKAVAEGFADGVHYADAGEEAPRDSPRAAYSFSRLAFQNSADRSIQRFLHHWKQVHGSRSLAMQLELIKLGEVKGDD